MVDKILEKRLPNLNLEYEIEVRDKNGELISYRREQSHSLVKNFALILQSLMAGTLVKWRNNSIHSTSVTLKTTSGEEIVYPNVSIP
ncbi:MAG: hypothetical protein QXJ45_07495, partial [Thermoproteota archaeon]